MSGRRILLLTLPLWIVVGKGPAEGGVQARETQGPRAGGEHLVTTALDSLQVIGQFEYAPHNKAVFGDTDHDGANEIILATQTPAFEGLLRILEVTNYGQFALAFEGIYVVPLAVGDIDQDGRSDLVGQGGGKLQVYESMDADSHPATLQWESAPGFGHLGFGAVEDTDSDGRLEIIFYANSRTVIFECEGDNTYVQKFEFPPTLSGRLDRSLHSIYNPWVGDELTWDLDQDRRPEIANVAQGLLQIFESIGDDKWEVIFTDSTELINARILSGGADSDGDGVRELFLGGDDEATFERKAFIYQPTGDRSFTRVATLTAVDGASGGQWGALARLAPDGQVRFLWALYEQLRIYVPSAPGVWILESIVPDPSPPHLAVYAYDLNRNGRDEVYWITNARTRSSLVLERPTLPTDVARDTPHALNGKLRVTPSPCQSNASVFLDRSVALQATDWSAFDASGRLVFQQKVVHPVPSIWTLQVQHLRPGLYFLRVTDALGRPLATGRATVIR